MAASSAGVLSHPNPTFHPCLIFSDALKVSSSSTFSHSLPSPPNRLPVSDPLSGSIPALPKNRRSVHFSQHKLRSKFFLPSCFRCGAKGHLTRNCTRSVRCYGCGRRGHKIYACSRSEKEIPESPKLQDLAFGWSEDSIQIQASQVRSEDSRVDCMLDDLDVLGCLASCSSVLPISVVVALLDVSNESTGDVDPVKSSEVESIGYSAIIEDEVRVDSSYTHSIFQSKVNTIGCPSTFGAVLGMGKGLETPAIARFGQRSKPRRLTSKGMLFDRAAKPWPFLNLMGLECLSGSNSFSHEEGFPTVSHRSMVPAAKEIAKDVVLAVYDLPIIEEDLSSDEETNNFSDLSHNQMELNLDPFPFEDVLGFEIIDDLHGCFSDPHSDVESLIKPASVDGFKKPKRAINLKPPAVIRRSPRLSKLVV